MDNFRNHNGSFFWANQILLHCIQIYLKNLAKVKWKIETYTLIFQTQKENYQKDKCSIQSVLYKGWYIQCHNPNYPPKNYHYGLFSSSGIGN
jgi:hypothetical protein